MGETRGLGPGGTGRAEHEEAQRRSAEAAAAAATAQASPIDASRRRDVERRPALPYLPPLSDDVSRRSRRARVKRHAPGPVDVRALSSMPGVEAAINAERTFLARYRTEMTPSVRIEHERTLGALWQHREAVAADARTCARKNADGARSAEQATAIFERQTGIKLPPWIKVVADPKLPADRHAE